MLAAIVVLVAGCDYTRGTGPIGPRERCSNTAVAWVVLPHASGVADSAALFTVAARACVR
jgi:hypothetical protein